jgi:type IV secretory pathway VirB3-like protein
MLYILGCFIILVGLIVDSPWMLVIGTVVYIFGIASGEHGE